VESAAAIIGFGAATSIQDITVKWSLGNGTSAEHPGHSNTGLAGDYRAHKV